jgi:hypothetical protein
MEGLAVQRPWWSSVLEFGQHVLTYSAAFIIFATAIVYGNAITVLVSHIGASKFVLHVLTALEYAIVVCDALFIAFLMIRDVLRNLKGLML